MIEAIDKINEQLGLNIGLTKKGDEVKGWSPDSWGDVSDFYLDAKDAQELADAFLALARGLQ